MRVNIKQNDALARQIRGESTFASYYIEHNVAKAFEAQCNQKITQYWQKFLTNIDIPRCNICVTLSAWIREMANGEYRVYILKLCSPDRKFGNSMVKMENYGLSFSEKGISFSFVS